MQRGKHGSFPQRSLPRDGLCKASRTSRRSGMLRSLRGTLRCPGSEELVPVLRVFAAPKFPPKAEQRKGDNAHADPDIWRQEKDCDARTYANNDYRNAAWASERLSHSITSLFGPRCPKARRASFTSAAMVLAEDQSASVNSAAARAQTMAPTELVLGRRLAQLASYLSAGQPPPWGRQQT